MRYTVVTGDFVRTGGMDVANFHLARYIAAAGNDLHLVAHRVDPTLAAFPGVTWHRVPKPLNSYLLGAPLLARAGMRWGRAGATAGGRVVVNGGNCQSADTNWVHYVHAGHSPQVAASTARRAMGTWSYRRFVVAERAALTRARLVIANSRRTAHDVVDRVGVDAARVQPVYYGTDAATHRPPRADERAAARQALGWTDDRPGVAFVGALGDRRKGFDLLFAAWEALCRESAWTARLVVIGAGAELPAWRARVARAGLADGVRFVGFTRDVRAVLWACDAIVAPARYEAYGLAVHEAVCCGLPAIVSAESGVAERLHGLEALQPATGGDPLALTAALLRWHDARDAWAARAAVISAELRAWTWDDMAARILELMAGA
jgi:glycosyltransferase involved in cell wall biosynthesis